MRLLLQVVLSIVILVLLVGLLSLAPAPPQATMGRLHEAAPASASRGFAATPSSVQNIYVNGCRESDGPGNGSEATPYSSLTRAVAVAPPGSNLVIQSGTYPETLAIQKKLTITSMGGPVRIGQPLSTKKVCQLTGERDLELNVDIGTHTVGVKGTDLGIPVEHNNRLWFLFGDTISSVGNTDIDGYRPFNGDSMAWVNANADPEQCLRLNFITAPDGNYLIPKIKAPEWVDCSIRSWIPVYALEVPTGAFSANGKMYVFYSTCFNGQDNPNEVMGKTVLARLDDETRNCFNYIYTVSCRPGNTQCHCDTLTPNEVVGKFINVSPVVVNNTDLSFLPDNANPQGKGVLLWGSGLYKKSDVYLAYLPFDKIEDRQALRYWHVDPAGRMTWEREESLASSIFDPSQPCVGELSVAWNPFLQKWLMLYTCDGAPGITYRVASAPWGKWSDPAILFNPWCDRGYCHFMHVNWDQTKCDSVYDDMQLGDPQRWGGAYAPYLISKFTKGDATSTTIYWLMSTWNPYQVVLMKSTLQKSCNCRL